MWICRWTGSSDRPLWSPTEPRRGTEKHMAGPGGVFIKFQRDFQPWRWTWNRIMEVWKIIFLSKWACSSSRLFCLRLCWGRGFWGNWMTVSSDPPKNSNNISYKNGQLHQTGSCWLRLYLAVWNSCGLYFRSKLQSNFATDIGTLKKL